MAKRGARTKWPTVAFGDVVRQVKDKVGPDSSGLERYVAGEHMDTDDLKIRRWGEIGNGYLGPAFHMRFKPGQVLYGSRRTYLRKVAVADFEGITANTTFVIESKDPALLLPELLPFIMQTEAFHQHSIRESKGSVNPYVNFSDLVWYEFALPPLDEQRRISKVLQGLSRAAENLHGAAQQAQATLDSFGKALFEKLVDDPSVGVARLCDLLATPICNGVFRTRDQFGSGVRLINVTDCYKGFRVPVENLDRVPVTNKEYQSFSAVEGDVIFNRSSLVLTGIGHACLVPSSDEQLVFECHLMRVRPRSGQLSGEFLARYALSPVGRRFIMSRAQTTTMTTIGQGDLGSMPVPCVDMRAQKEVCMECQAIEAAMQKLKERERDARTMLSRVQSGLLAVAT